MPDQIESASLSTQKTPFEFRLMPTPATGKRRRVKRGLEIRASVEVQAAVGAVFATFTDLEAAAAHSPGIDRIELVDGPRQMAIGTRWRETRTMRGRSATEEMWVVELRAPLGFSVDAASAGTVYRAEYTFVELAPERTRVELVFSGRPETFGARIAHLLGAPFAGATRKLLESDMIGLRDAIEAAAPAPALREESHPGPSRVV